MQILHIPCLEDNYSYLIIDDDTKEAAVVDPVEPHKILRVAQENGVNLKLLLTTHHHWDHAGGNDKMKQLVPEIKVFGGSLDNVQGCTNKLENGDTLSLGNHINILSLHTPCHTKGHISYYVTGKEGDDPAVFTGDTMFIAGCGKFFEGTAEQMYQSLCTTLGSLPKPTQVYCGHESGYHVKQVGQYSFSCQKLGQILVHLYSREDSNEPFPSVLLSLSGEDGYRNNSVTGVGGTFMFDHLFPGSFYLGPLLKEYAFSPPAQAIDIGSGESKEVVFYATRVAFSALGMVTLLSGQPKEGVSVEARAESKGFYEETVTDSSGSYRLRGLQPDTAYVIKVGRRSELDGAIIERASPKSLTIKVGKEDIKNLNFVVFEQPDITILSGHVEGKDIKGLRPHIRVEIRSLPSKAETIFPLPISNFFQVKDLPKGKHLVQLRSSMPSSSYRFESEAVEVDLESQSQIHVGPLSYRIVEDIYKQELTPAPVYPVVVGISVIALFISMPRWKDLVQALVGLSTKKDAKKLNVRKKTY